MTDKEPINDGGLAFPMPSGAEPRVDETTHYNEGMTYRQWLAGMAMQGMLSNGQMFDDSEFSEKQCLAFASVNIADAMIAKLQGGK